MTNSTADISKAARILLAGDDPDVLEGIGAMLARRGFTVTSADSWAAVLVCLAAGPFDLVITDCRMSPVDGWAALKAQHPSTLVIILTGCDDTDTAVSALQKEADDFIQKPVTAETLFSRIDICLERQALAERCKSVEATLEMTNRAIEAIREGLVICDAAPPDYPIKFVNKGFETLTGYAANDVLGRNMSFLQGGGTDPDAVAGIRMALRSKEAYSCDILNYRRDGHPFWNHLTISPVCDEDGTVMQFIATIMDISMRKNAEEKRRISEMRYRRLFENTTDTLIIYDAETGTIEDANPTALHLFGYSLEEMRRLSARDLDAADAALAEMAGLSRMDLIDKPVSILRGKNGTPFAADVSRGVFVHAQKEKIIETIKDITPRLIMESRLRESESRFRQLSESIDEVFWLVSDDMTQTFFISPAYELMWDQPCDEIMGSPETRLSRIYPPDRFKVLSSIQPPPQQPYELTYRLESPRGELKWIRERGFPVRNASGHVFRLAVVFSDITEETRLQEEMKTQLQQVVHADRLAAIGEVVAGVAHEINNPNSFITYNIPLLEETWQAFLPIVDAYARQHPENGIAHLSFTELMADMTEIIAAIKTGSERINRIVTNLKDFARLDESTHSQPVCINTVVEKAMSIVGAQLRKSADVVEVTTTDPMPKIQGHFQKLEQVVVNLLVNAAHAIPQKTAGRIVVRTRVVERLGAVLLEVEDNGTGIGAQHRERLFEPFFTTRRTEGGTGLGLSVSYGLVKEHGGTIGVLSQPNRGSCFTVFLPLSVKGPLELNPTILCVDDQPGVLKLVRSMLIKTEDRFVKTVADPAQVIDFLETHPEIDIVISDIRMPKIDGWQLLKKIRDRFPLIGVILFSGHTDAIDRNPDPTTVPDAIVRKPFERADLVQAIHSVGRMKL